MKKRKRLSPKIKAAVKNLGDAALAYTRMIDATQVVPVPHSRVWNVQQGLLDAAFKLVAACTKYGAKVKA